MVVHIFHNIKMFISLDRKAEIWKSRPFLGTVPAVWELKPEHCRAARYLLGWTVSDLGRISGVSHATIGRFERDEVVPHSRTVRDLLRTFEEAGVKWIEGEPTRPHVKCGDGTTVVVEPTAE